MEPTKRAITSADKDNIITQPSKRTRRISAQPLKKISDNMTDSEPLLIDESNMDIIINEDIDVTGKTENLTSVEQKSTKMFDINLNTTAREEFNSSFDSIFLEDGQLFTEPTPMNSIHDKGFYQHKLENPPCTLVPLTDSIPPLSGSISDIRRVKPTSVTSPPPQSITQQDSQKSSNNIRNDVVLTHFLRDLKFKESATANIIAKGFAPYSKQSNEFVNHPNCENRIIYTPSTNTSSFAARVTCQQDNPTKITLGKIRKDISQTNDYTARPKNIEILPNRFNHFFSAITQVCQGEVKKSGFLSSRGDKFSVEKRVNGDILISQNTNAEWNDTERKIIVPSSEIYQLQETIYLCQDLIQTFTTAHEFCEVTMRDMYTWFSNEKNNCNRDQLYKRSVEHFYTVVSPNCTKNITINFAMKQFCKHFNNMVNVLP